jgi:hypothetical protein
MSSLQVSPASTDPLLRQRGQRRPAAVGGRNLAHVALMENLTSGYCWPNPAGHMRVLNCSLEAQSCRWSALAHVANIGSPNPIVC